MAITKAEAVKIFKKYGIMHDILMEPYHNPKLGDKVKEIIKDHNNEIKERQESNENKI